MPSIGLIEAYWKTERARYHLDELKATIRKWTESKPYVLTPEDNVEQALHKITIKFADPVISAPRYAAAHIQSESRYVQFKPLRDPWLIQSFNRSSSLGQVANDTTDSAIAELDGSAF